MERDAQKLTYGEGCAEAFITPMVLLARTHRAIMAK